MSIKIQNNTARFWIFLIRKDCIIPFFTFFRLLQRLTQNNFPRQRELSQGIGWAFSIFLENQNFVNPEKAFSTTFERDVIYYPHTLIRVGAQFVGDCSSRLTLQNRWQLFDVFNSFMKCL